MPVTSCIWDFIGMWVGIRRRMSTILSALKWIKKEGRGTLPQSKLQRIALASDSLQDLEFEEPSHFQQKIISVVDITRSIQIHMTIDVVKRTAAKQVNTYSTASERMALYLDSEVSHGILRMETADQLIIWRNTLMFCNQ